MEWRKNKYKIFISKKGLGQIINQYKFYIRYINIKEQIFR